VSELLAPSVRLSANRNSEKGGILKSTFSGAGATEEHKRSDDFQNMQVCAFQHDKQDDRSQS